MPQCLQQPEWTFKSLSLRLVLALGQFSYLVAVKQRLHMCVDVLSWNFSDILWFGSLSNLGVLNETVLSLQTNFSLCYVISVVNRELDRFYVVKSTHVEKQVWHIVLGVFFQSLFWPLTYFKETRVLRDKFSVVVKPHFYIFVVLLQKIFDWQNRRLIFEVDLNFRNLLLQRLRYRFWVTLRVLRLWFLSLFADHLVEDLCEWRFLCVLQLNFVLYLSN